MNSLNSDRRRSLCAGDLDSPLAFSLQTLLLRHEEYAVHAEEERNGLHNTIAQLKTDNSNLFAQNSTLLKDNLELKQRTKSLEETISEADLRNDNLKEMLSRAEVEVQRLAAFAMRTEVLETQLEALELKQHQLQDLLNVKEEAGHRDPAPSTKPQQQTPTQCNNLKKKIHTMPLVTVLEDEEKENGVENELVVERPCEYRRTEDDLQANAKQSTVVTSFVEGLLQNNSGMQYAMAQQAEIVSKLQDEVEQLRERLSLHPNQHQPYTDMDNSVRRSSVTSERVIGNISSSDLDDITITARNLQEAREVHVHHHYHGPPPAAIPSHTTLIGRSKSQSYATRSNGRRFPVAIPQVRSPSIVQQLSQSRPPLQPVSNNAVSHSMLPATPVTTLRMPSGKPSNVKSHVATTNRYSGFSVQTGLSFPVSSNPSSPQSTVFEQYPNIDGSEYSRPTSRGSSVVWHPVGEDLAEQSMDARANQDSVESPDPECGKSQNVKHSDAQRRRYQRLRRHELFDHDVSFKDTQTASHYNQLHRTPSLLSISGMDIHTSSPAPLASTSLRTRLPNTMTSPMGPRLSSSLVPSMSPAMLTAVTATVMQSSTHDDGRTDGNACIITKQKTKSTTATSTEGALSRSLLGRSISMPEPQNNTQPSTIAMETPPSKMEGKAYAPLVDTFGKRVGGWLTNRLASGMDDQKLKRGMDTTNGKTGSFSRPIQKADQSTMRTASRAMSSSSRESRFGTPLGIERTTSSSSVSTQAKSELDKSTESTQVKLDENKRLLQIAGIDPVNGLPALRQVSGVKSPKLLGVVDKDALQECLMDLSDVSDAEEDGR